MNSNSEVLKSIAQKAKRRLIGKEETTSAKIKVITNDDEDFRSKVEYLLSHDDVITNPVHFLMDDKILKGLNSEEAKERYLLTTLDKYNSFKNQIENVSSYSRFCM